MKLNKRILDLIAGFSSVLTIIAAFPYQKELIQLFPPKVSPIIAYIFGSATVILKTLAYFAPPTPSPTPAQAAQEKKN